ncbi:nucleotide-binding universal stress UspA family protein [Kribbella voronezhensis]|uniref:Nucleotide-binding universal stress UspA family protein n=1 Tax=Kribbella voronezhensis TaxID=2512212 RepID=A0A4R7SZ09_9ACTN|nr:universal stress protein [Kribbella voronezhensis]TDU83767.1 nucleotide-binding universal stress UspA family protein [Kribbella voronezhensis]
MNESTIFVGVDAAWQNSGALDWALREAHLRGLPVRAVHVVEEKLPAGPYFAAPGVDAAAKHLIADVDDYLAGHDDGAAYTTDVLTGPPASKLAKAAAGAEMLVVGRRGTGLLSRLLIGSTAEAVTHLADVPVVVVPDRWQPYHPGAPVVVGVDESDQDDAAIAFAIAAATERKVPLRMVRVWDLPAMYTWDAAAVTNQYDGWLEQSDKALQAMADQWRVKYPELEIQTETRRGHPVAGLISAAEENKADLLVLGGRNHRRITTMLLGSTARGVLHHAPCPVAVVHEVPQEK